MSLEISLTFWKAFNMLYSPSLKWNLRFQVELFESKSQSLTFQCTVKFWSIDWKIHLSIQCNWGLLNLLNRSIWFHWVLESMLELNLPLARSKSQKLPLYSQNPKNHHFALLVIWYNFLWNCGPNLIKWFIWVYNVDVGQKIMRFDCQLATFDFFPNTADF